MLIDVSNHQGTINWAQTDPAIDGAYVKVTEGTGYTDPYWPADHAGAVAGGKPVGAYHFADGADPVAEANHFADQYLRAAWQLDPVLDAEVPAVGALWVRAFRAQFRARTGKARFRLYASTGYLASQLNPANWIDAASTIWAAHYAATIGWNHPQLVLWQNTSAATIPGILGSVDADQYQNGWTPAADQGGNVTTPSGLTGDQAAQLEAACRILQSMYFYGSKALPADLTKVPDWRGGGDLGWFQQQMTTANAPILAQLSTLSGALSADEAAIVGAVQGADNDTKVGIAQLLAVLAAPGKAIDVAALAAGIAADLPAQATPAQTIAAFAAQLAK
jgi:hypothetical protein